MQTYDIRDTTTDHILQKETSKENAHDTLTLNGMSFARATTALHQLHSNHLAAVHQGGITITAHRHTTGR